METLIRAAVISSLILTLPGLANAGTRDPLVNKRQDRQEDRIKQGVASGELTKREARRLHRKEHAIKAKEEAYKADGTLTATERKDLHQDLNALSKDIKREKHDLQQR